MKYILYNEIVNTEAESSNSFEIVKTKLNAMSLKFSGSSYPYEEYYRANYS